MNRKLFPFIFASLFSTLTTACGQKATSLSKEDVEKASAISFYTDNGTVAPDYHWGMTITVSPKQVNLQVVKGYSGKVVYDKTLQLTPAQYQQFIGGINQLSIKKRKFNGPYTTGGSSEYLCIKRGPLKVFDANKEELHCEGDLTAVFQRLLSDEMAQVFRHPDDL